MKLGYSYKWYELGIITEDDIINQCKEQVILDDFHDEHMRYKSLVRFYKSGKLTNENIELLYSLLELDPDQSMVFGFFLFLIRDVNLEDSIFDYLYDKLLKIDTRYEQEFNRAQIRREYNKNKKLSFLTIEKYIHKEKYHRLLVEYSYDKEILIRIAKFSSSKKIHNLINAKVNISNDK